MPVPRQQHGAQEPSVWQKRLCPTYRFTWSTTNFLQQSSKTLQSLSTLWVFNLVDDHPFTHFISGWGLLWEEVLV